ncbi:unnamed protein product [Hymenolepis diminuta]|uniref:Uncharacterized protein n=1 Tax=Hymenolepis diminuta TaxID=6216 RepID=A0A564YMF9_HYMDI|nr:unnamed protein product [Hymenolepis diminuta]
MPMNLRLSFFLLTSYLYSDRYQHPLHTSYYTFAYSTRFVCMHMSFAACMFQPAPHDLQLTDVIRCLLEFYRLLLYSLTSFS